MASALLTVDWEPCVVEPVHDAELMAYAREKFGIPMPSMQYFAPAPWVGRANVDLMPDLGLLVHMEHEVCDLVCLAVSQENSCRFCHAAQRFLLWARGMSAARLDRMERDFARADLPPRTLAAISFGRALSGSHTGAAAARAARDALAQAGFSDKEMLEVAYTVADAHFSNRLHTFLAISPRAMEELPARWTSLLMRPLLRRMVNSRRRHGKPAESGGTTGPYVFSTVVDAYSGLPVAGVLRKTLDAMWASPHLSRRAKLLIVAVVARGLGSDDVMASLAPELESEGLGAAAVADVLAHLDSPEIGAHERLLVAFARDTIWYQPAAAQRSTRSLRSLLTPAQVVEAVGVASLANGLCRLSGAVVAPA